MMDGKKMGRKKHWEIFPIAPRYFVDRWFYLLEKIYIFSMGDEILSEILNVALVENCRVVSSITKWNSVSIRYKCRERDYYLAFDQFTSIKLITDRQSLFRVR